MFNVQPRPVDVAIEATFSDGHVGRLAFRLAPGERRPTALSSLRPPGPGQFDAGLRVTVSQPAAVSVALWDDAGYVRQGVSRDLPRVPVCSAS